MPITSSDDTLISDSSTKEFDTMAAENERKDSIIAEFEALATEEACPFLGKVRRLHP